MLLSSEPITGADTPLEVALGLGALLAFVAVVVRAFAARWASRRRGWAGPDPARRAPEPAARVTGLPARDAEDLASRLCEPVAEAPERELGRLKGETLAPLARILDAGRRLGAAEDRIGRELAALPESFWLAESGVFVDGRRIPFLVVGATGVFLTCASDGAWTLGDLQVMSELGDRVGDLLPGYDGRPHAAVCLAFDEMKPRAWFGGEELGGRGGWVLGADWLQRWMLGFGPEYGLRNGDVRHLDEASGPFWHRRSTARLPATPNLG